MYSLAYPIDESLRSRKSKSGIQEGRGPAKAPARVRKGSALGPASSRLSQYPPLRKANVLVASYQFPMHPQRCRRGAGKPVARCGEKSQTSVTSVVFPFSRQLYGGAPLRLRQAAGDLLSCLPRITRSV